MSAASLSEDVSDLCFFSGMWLGFRNFGTVVGSSINLGLNATTRTAGSLSSSTYIVFVSRWILM